VLHKAFDEIFMHVCTFLRAKAATAFSAS